jgi:hypothetical protein
MSKTRFLGHRRSREEVQVNVVLAILYAPEGQKPLSIARVGDRDLLSAAAETAIHEAEELASVLMKSDPTLGALQLQEADKLRRVLAYLLPKQAVPIAGVM